MENSVTVELEETIECNVCVVKHSCSHKMYSSVLNGILLMSYVS